STARAFGEKNVAAGFHDEALTEGINGVAAAIFSPHGKSVHHAGSEDREGGRFEKSVAGGEGENTVSQTERQGGSQDERVEVAGMVGDDYERSRQGKMFASDDFDAFREPKDAAHPPPPKIAGNETDEATFAFQRTQALNLGDSEVLRRFVLPIVHDIAPGRA